MSEAWFLQRNRCLIVVLHVYNSTGGLSSTSQRSSSWFQLCSDSKETWRWLWPLGCPQRWDANLCYFKQTLHPLPVCLKCLSLMDMPDVSLGCGGRVWHPFSSFIQPPAEFILWLLSQPAECPPSCCWGDVSPRACAAPFLSCKLVSTDEPPWEHTYQQLLEADDEVKERRPLAPSMHAASTPFCQHVPQELQLCKLIVFPKCCWAGSSSGQNRQTHTPARTHTYLPDTVPAQAFRSYWGWEGWLQHMGFTQQYQDASWEISPHEATAETSPPSWGLCIKTSVGTLGF